MRFLTKKIDENNSDITIIYAFENCKNDSELYKYLNEQTNGELEKQIYQYKTIKGSLSETYKFSINENKKIIVVGLGKKENLTRLKFSQAIASASR